jgi:hypothetical protein
VTDNASNVHYKLTCTVWGGEALFKFNFNLKLKFKLSPAAGRRRLSSRLAACVFYQRVFCMDWKKPIKRAPAVRLTSSASYTRPVHDADPANLPLLTTHRVTYSYPNADMAVKCVESFRSQKSCYMVKMAAQQVPIDVVDAHEAAVGALFDAETAAAMEVQRAKAAALKERRAPAASEAEAKFAGMLAQLPRCPMKNMLVRTDFYPSNDDPTNAPFPGSVSAYGKHQAEIYNSVTKDAAAGRLKTVRASGLNHLGQRFKH